MAAGTAGSRVPWLGLAAFALVALTALLVNPAGDFPLHDDWVHRQEVDFFHATGQFARAPILTSTLVAQVLWGDLFARLLGLDYEVLRLSTLVLAAIGLWAAARSALELGASRPAALLVAAAVWFVPVSLPLAFTFMSDVPFASVLLLAAFTALRALRSLRPATSAVAILLFFVAFFIRQHALVVLAAYLLALALAVGVGARPSRGFYLASALALGLGVVAAAAWYLGRPVNPEQAAWLGNLAGFASVERLRQSVRLLALAAAGLGLFSLPLQFLERDAPPLRARLPWIAGLFILGMLAIRGTGGPLPIGHDVLHDLGAGWRDLTSEANPFGSAAPLALGRGAWWALTMLGMLGAAAGLEGLLRLARRAWQGRRTGELAGDVRFRQVAFLVLWMGLFAASLLPFLPRTADRYLIPVMLPGFLLLGLGARMPRRVPARVGVGVVLAVLAIFSTAATQDYLAWNRARWLALADLSRVAAPTEIDGGFAWNGPFTRDAYRQLYGRGDDRRIGRRGFWVVEDRYAIGFAPRSGFTVIARYPYFTWLGMTRRDMLVLARTGPVPPNPPRESGEDYDTTF